MGLVLGLLGAFLCGIRGLVYFFYCSLPELAEIWQHRDLPALLQVAWERVLLNQFVRNPWNTSVVWTGVVAGLGSDLLGKRRYNPLAALILGVALGVGNGLFPVLAGRIGALDFLVSGTLVSGLALLVVALVVREIQGRMAQEKAAAAELALARAELRALRAQINPHFFFNALNTIRYFVRTDPETARRLLLHFSEVFQRALRSGEFVPLREELGHVEAYLSLEQARLGERLRVEWAVRAEQYMECPVPTLILQPVVENAVVHGVASRSQGGVVRITVLPVTGDLTLQVEDDGPGIAPDRLAAILGPRNGTSVGLHNVDSRLQALYGEGYHLVVESEVGHGTRVCIRVPLREEEPCTS